MKPSFLPKIVVCCLAFVGPSRHAHSKNVVIMVDSTIKEVSFGGGSNPEPVTGHHTLRDDGGLPAGPKLFVAPHWTRDPISPETTARRYPVAHTKFTTPTVEMKFNLNVTIPAGTTSTAEVWAMGSDSVNLPVRTIGLQNGPITYTYPATSADSAFPDQIRFYGPTAPFTLTWWIKNDNGTEIQLDGPTLHRLYLTAGTPACKRGNRETLFYYACNKPNGLSGAAGTEDVVTKKIYESFSTPLPLTMKKIDHETGLLSATVLYYYQETPPPQLVGELLVDGTGICGDWARFLADVLNVHHYTSQIIDLTAANIEFPDGQHQGSGWFVKGMHNIDPLLRYHVGQGPGKSQCGWLKHTILSTYGHYYDPSYGLGPCESEKEYENAAVGSYFYPVPLGNDIDYEKLLRTDEMLKQLDYTPKPY